MFSVVFIELVAFGVAAAMVRARLWEAAMLAVAYLPAMLVVIYWIGYGAGYYDLP